MTINMIKPFAKSIKTLVLSSVVMLATASNATLAQQQQSQVKLQGSGWYKVCSEIETGNVCNVQFQVQTTDNQLMTAVNVIDIEGEEKRGIFRIVVQSGRSLAQGVQITVDGKKATAIPYIFCKPNICTAEVALNSDDLVKVFKAGGALDVTTINFRGQQQAIPITLKGFTAAYDGPPIEPPDSVAQEQDKLKKQLEQKLQTQSE